MSQSIKTFTSRERDRIDENLDLILIEAKARFNNQKDAWNDLDRKVFYMLGFVSIFVGFIVSNNLLDMLGFFVSTVFFSIYYPIHKQIFLLSLVILIFMFLIIWNAKKLKLLFLSLARECSDNFLMALFIMCSLLIFIVLPFFLLPRSIMW